MESETRKGGKAAVHMISAWAEQNRLVLGQMKVDDKTNEITAIPELLELLDVHGCIVTIDAMGCQSSIAAKIVEQEADYVLAVKENQGALLRDIQDTFEMAEKAAYHHIAHDQYEQVCKGHGRLEMRRYCTISDPDAIAYFNRDQRWPGLRSIGRVQTERRAPVKATQHRTWPRFVI